MNRKSYRSRLLAAFTAIIIVTGLYTNASADSDLILINPTSGLVTSEQGGQAAFEVVLAVEPEFFNFPITIFFNIDEAGVGEGQVDPASVIFTQEDWFIPKTITVTGLDDEELDGDVPYMIVTPPIDSVDETYDGQDPSDVSVTNRDSEGGPVAQADSAATDQGEPVSVPVLENDQDLVEAPFSVTVETAPANGNAQVSADNAITYTPNPEFVGIDTFDYQVCDSYTRCSSAQVSVEVKPVANPDSYEVGQDSTLDVPPPGLLSNDSQTDSVTLTTELEQQPSFGSLELNPDGAFSYTPEQGYVGQDSFTYVVSEGSLNSEATEVTIDVVDQEPPAVSWVYPPVDDENVYFVGWETVVLSAEASDNISIDKVHFFRWDALSEQFVDLGVVTSPPYELEFYAGDLPLEWNEIFVRAYDSTGNVSTREHIWLYQTGNLYLPLIASQ